MKPEHLKNVLRVLRRFYRTFQIPVSLWNSEEKTQISVAEGFEPDPALYYLQEALDAGAEETCLIHKHETLYGFVRDGGSPLVVLLGPVDTGFCTEEPLRKILRDLGQSLSRQQEFQRWLNKSPVMDRAHFVSLLSFFHSLLNIGDPVIQDLDTVEVSDTRTPESSMKMQDVIHNTEALEREVLQAITVGDTAHLLQVLPLVANSDAGAGRFPGGPVRTMKNLFIIAAALCSRAAVKGGMDYDHALTIADNYIRRAEMMKTVGEILPHLGMMMTDLSDRVAKLRQPQDCSPLTQQVLRYLHAHMREPVTLEQIASYTNHSVSHISHSFSSDMGKGIKEYLCEQRIEEAKRLLLLDNRSAADIATQLGFSSQAHFQTSFRKVTGTTPMQYKRDAMKAASPAP